MIVKIRTSHEYAATYGSPRVWLALRRQWVRCGRKRVERIMREHGEGVLWLASVRDAFSNKVVGWATTARADTELVLTALGHALRSRNIHDGQLVHHSDKGCPVHGSAVHPAAARRGHRLACGVPPTRSVASKRGGCPGCRSRRDWPTYVGDAPLAFLEI